jgi:hypothetical protein
VATIDFSVLLDEYPLVVRNDMTLAEYHQRQWQLRSVPDEGSAAAARQNRLFSRVHAATASVNRLTRRFLRLLLIRRVGTRKWRRMVSRALHRPPSDRILEFYEEEAGR